ncbi:MAG: (Fe-S)-binding protein, partial [Candidatus Helarchaeota archaeon]
MEDFDYNFEQEKRKIIPLMRQFATHCTACGICIENCVFHDYSREDGRQIMGEIKKFLLSKKLDKKLSKKTKKFIWNCGICEHCNNKCPLPDDKKIPRSPMIVLLRGLLVIKNEAPILIRLVRLLLFKDENNPVLESLWPIAGKILVPGWYDNKDELQIKERKAIEKARRYPDKGAEVCFFGGCGHTNAIPDSVYGTISILEQAGIDHITIGNPAFCCGVVYILMGYFDIWLKHTYKVMKNYLKLTPRPKRLLLHCPGCYTIYQFDLSQYGLILPLNYLRIMNNPIKMMHVSEYILELIKEEKIKLKGEVPLVVTYQDNCSIGRRMAKVGKSVYDEPREILNNIPGIKLVEANNIRENAYCCGLIATKTQGMGTNIKLIGKDKAYTIQRDLYKYLIEHESKNLVTPCMGCALVYEDSARFWSNKLGSKINILELSELVNRSIGINIPQRYFDLNNVMSLSAPFIKPSIIKVIPRMIKTHAFRDIFNFIKKMINYSLKRKK